MKNEELKKFLEDTWIGSTSLKETFISKLYQLLEENHVLEFLYKKKKKKQKKRKKK